MKTLSTIDELLSALAEPRREECSIGLVPTMGAFHDGHLSLMRRARTECDCVVVSLFVNPAQFNEAADLELYPRDRQRDTELASELGVDYLFAPDETEMYPADFASTVSIGAVTSMLEGATRGRAHFDGVATIVTKLFNIIGPDVAYFGQKDAQQALVIKRLVRDLNIPVRIEVCPTLREPDGVAMSSRNALLSDADRVRASALHRALTAADQAVADGKSDPAEVTALARAELDADGIELEYLELVSPETLAPVQSIEGQVLALIAARIGRTRLIDNQLLSPRRVAVGAHTNGRP